MHSVSAFVDESGDLGMLPCSSGHTTIGAVVTDDTIALERIPRDIRKRRLKKSLQRKPELKFRNSGPEIREIVLRRVSELEDVAIASITVRKDCLSDQLMSDKDGLCLVLCGQLAGYVARLAGRARSLSIVFDNRPFNRGVGKDFDEAILAKAEHQFEVAGMFPPRITVSRFDSQRSRGLQVADFVVGAIQRKYELGDGRYYDIIAPAVRIERRYRF